NGTVIQWNGDGKPSSIGSTSFVYDGLGVRLKKTTGSQTTRYLGGDYEIGPAGVITKYLQGGKKVGAQFFIHHRDHLGSIQSVTNSSGVEVRGQKHKPFGDQFGVTGSHVERKGWIGEREEETELVYLNARYYDPEIGRFVSPDPIVVKGQLLNRYTYSANNPINFLDPTGLLNCAGTLDVQGGCGGGGGGNIFLFDFSDCHGMALARGDCDPGLQQNLSDTRHDPNVDAMLAEEEARHDEMVNQTVLGSLVADLVSSGQWPCGGGGPSPCNTQTEIAQGQEPSGFFFEFAKQTGGLPLPDFAIDELKEFIPESQLKDIQLHHGVPEIVDSFNRFFGGRGVAAVTFGKDIWVSTKVFDDVFSAKSRIGTRTLAASLALVAHESIHYGNTLHTGNKITFTAVFLGTYLLNRTQMNHTDAYKSIPSEAAAQAMQAIVFQSKRP
ncbi:MAG: RHS repeat domain-containing protein, partial [Vicinamibacteria bacterium]